jgi:AcrR family transcriptional regulator
MTASELPAPDLTAARAPIVRAMPDPPPASSGRPRKPTSPHDIQLPSGRHGLSREFVVSHQRERILRALAETVRGYGYAASSVERVASRAGVSRRTFYEQFSGKEDAYLHAYDEAAGQLLRHVQASAGDAADGLDERLRRCLDAFLTGLAAEPVLAHLCVVDVLVAGPAAIDQRDRYQRDFADVLEQLAADDDRTLPPLAAEGLVGAIYDLAYKRIAQDRADELPSLVDDLHSFALAVLRSPPPLT